MKDRRKPWQKTLKTFPIAKCGSQLAENARKFYKYTPPAYVRSKNPEAAENAYADALGITTQEAREKIAAHYHIQRYGRPAC